MHLKNLICKLPVICHDSIGAQGYICDNREFSDFSIAMGDVIEKPGPGDTGHTITATFDISQIENYENSELFGYENRCVYTHSPSLVGEGAGG
jgi:hypothetical protein